MKRGPLREIVAVTRIAGPIGTARTAFVELVCGHTRRYKLSQEPKKRATCPECEVEEYQGARFEEDPYPEDRDNNRRKGD